MTRKLRAGLMAAAALMWSAGMALAEPQHGISMYGEPELPQDFVALPYANPDAPQGGRIVFGENNTFDSLHPYILKGKSAWGVRAHVFESLMGRNWDEAFALYGLLAESIETPEDRSWVEFTLRAEARFSDGSPVTVEDVLWSWETLAEFGLPGYRRSWNKVSSASKVGPRTLRLEFSVPDRELPLIYGLRPVLKKADWDGVDFAASGLRVPVASGPYVVGKVEAGRYVEFERNPDYWGNALGLNKGRHNLDVIRYEYFTDAATLHQAFTAGLLSAKREFNAAKWAQDYNFPAVQSGDVIKSEIPHQRPSGMYGLVFNTRKEIFADWRVRDALIHAFNFEFVNSRLNGGALPRISSYFSNSGLGMEAGAAKGEVLELLNAHSAELLPGAVEGYALPTATDERNRKGLRHARAQLKEAGWEVQDGTLVNSEGAPFRFSVMIGLAGAEGVVNIFADALKRLGIEVSLDVVDAAQQSERKTAYDYDMMFNRWGLSLSPGNEQWKYWGSDGVSEPGTRNYMGMNSAAADAMITGMLEARSRESFVAHVRALDRVLISGRYVIPLWYQPKSMLAHRKELRYPEKLPVYGDWTGFLPDVWWHAE